MGYLTASNDTEKENEHGLQSYSINSDGLKMRVNNTWIKEYSKKI